MPRRKLRTGFHRHGNPDARNGAMDHDGGLLAMSDARGRSRSLLPERVAENLNRVFILRGIVENLRKIGWLEKNQKWFSLRPKEWKAMLVKFLFAFCRKSKTIFKNK